MRDNKDKMRDSKVRRNNGRAVEAGAPSSESDFVNSVKAATEVPRSSFEFYVWSDEGVNLQVDLTSSPSDWTNWTNRFKNEVRISENVNGNQSRSLWQDLSGLGQKSSFLWNTNHCPINDRDGQPKCSSGLKLTKDGVAELEQQKKDEKPLISYSLAPRNMTVKVADNLMQYQSTVSAEVSYGAPGNYISGAESCAKDTTKEILTLDAHNAPFNNSLCDSVGNSLSDLGTLKLQHSKPDNECSRNCGIPNGSCIVNPGVVCAGASSSSSEELQNSEVASCHKYTSVSPRDNDGSMDLCDPKNSSEMEQGGLVNSSKINFVTDGNNFLSKTKEMV